MKVLGTALILAVASLLSVLPDFTPAPAPVRVEAPTQESIIASIKAEQKAKQYARATEVAERFFHKRRECLPFAGLVGQQAVDSGLPVRLLAALQIVESACNPTAVSKTGDYGLYQLNKKWHREYTVAELLNPVRNAQIASRELRKYVRQFGLVEGLHHYNGLGTVDNPTDNGYAVRVLAVAGISAS